MIDAGDLKDAASRNFSRFVVEAPRNQCRETYSLFQLYNFADVAIPIP
jgi:hypothetical protein